MNRLPDTPASPEEEFFLAQDKFDPLEGADVIAYWEAVDAMGDMQLFSGTEKTMPSQNSHDR